jgi:hypothetical protein
MVEPLMEEGRFSGLNMQNDIGQDGASKKKQGTAKDDREHSNLKESFKVVGTGRKTKTRKLFRPDMGPDKDWFDDQKTQKEEVDKCIYKTPKATGVEEAARRVDIVNMPKERLNLKKQVTRNHAQSVHENDGENEKRPRYGKDDKAKKMKMPTHKRIPVKAGGPYLCDSDSDVTVPITMVEELEKEEGWEE